MIITCKNCTKKFKVDSTVIPEKGRLLQCNSCNHKWFFKKEIVIKPTEEVIIKKPTIDTTQLTEEPKPKEIASAKTIDFLDEEVSETKEAIQIDDKPEIIDGFGDVAFVALNGIYKEFRFQGNSHDEAKSKVEEVMKRICTANLGKKQADGTIKYVNGKVQKPEGWTPPVYEDISS